MNCQMINAQPPSGSAGFTERRRQSRIYRPFPVRAQGPWADGREFDVETTVVNICADGLYVLLEDAAALAAEVSLVVSFSQDGDADRAPRIAFRGRVLRSQLLIDGRYGVAVVFSSHKFI